MSYKPKMRIIGRNLEGIITSDRLVDQALELNSGCKDNFEGPVTLEITLGHKDTLPALIEYLRQLNGQIPLSEKATTYIPKSKIVIMAHEAYEAFIRDLTQIKDQVKLIEYLRPLGFNFYTDQHLEDLGIKINLKEKHNRYQFMLKRVKETKDPLTEKLDEHLAIAIKVVGNHVDKIHFYYKNPENPSQEALEHIKLIKMPWPDNHTINFKKAKIGYKFPKHMHMDDRQKWRREHAILERYPDKKPSKFYTRWQPDVIKL